MTKVFAGFDTQAELDLQYDPTRGVPDFNVYVERFISQSAAARTRFEHRSGLPYGPSKAEHVNIFLPQSPPAAWAPIFIFIHGGYWVAFEADAFDLVAPGPVEAGFAVVNITYALCSGVTISEIVRQVRAAIAWTCRNAASFGEGAGPFDSGADRQALCASPIPKARHAGAIRTCPARDRDHGWPEWSHGRA